MKVQETKRALQIQEWAMQISEREQSGLTVKEWCEKNGVKIKTYYNRVRIVREEILENMHSGSGAQISATQMTGIAGICGTSTQQEPDMALQIGDRGVAQTAVFAALPMPQCRGAAITVRMGGYAIDIQSGADSTAIEQVLKAVSRL